MSAATIAADAPALPADAAPPLLEIRDLAVTYRTPAGLAHAVDGADLTVPHGAMLGLVGESGCGKTTLARAIMGVLPGNARVARGQIRLDGTDLVALSPRQRRSRLWREVSFVPQSAMNALDPVYRLRDRLREVLCGRGGLSHKAADERAEALFAAVGLGAPARLADFPHQFSGGMRQRAAIALALALRPKLVVADEPVTALDVIVQRQVLGHAAPPRRRDACRRRVRDPRHRRRRLSLQHHRGDVRGADRRIRPDAGRADPAGASPTRWG